MIFPDTDKIIQHVSGFFQFQIKAIVKGLMKNGVLTLGDCAEAYSELQQEKFENLYKPNHENRLKMAMDLYCYAANDKSERGKHARKAVYDSGFIDGSEAAKEFEKENPNA